MAVVGVDRETLLETAERIRHKAELESVSECGQQIHFSVSIGLSMISFSETEDNLALAIKAADSAMYRAKATGRNRVEFSNH